jgi:O-antigen ligase
MPTVPTSASYRGYATRAATWLAAAAAASLPWSTSATGILAVLWLIAAVPVLDRAVLATVLRTPSALLPLALWLMCAVAMLWAPVPWAERVAGLSGYHKLLLIPLFLAHFAAGGQVKPVVLGFFVSCLALLLYSWAIVAWTPYWGAVYLPGFAKQMAQAGLPVKDYIFQSGLFILCAFGLFGFALERWRYEKALAIVCILVALLFIANVLLVASSRTGTVVMLALVVLFGLRHFAWHGFLGGVAAAAVLTALLWVSARHLDERVGMTLNAPATSDFATETGSGDRLEFWRNSLRFVAQAPVIGHGTGSIKKLFADAGGAVTTNPHNQVFAVAIPAGLIGAAILLAMWAAHVFLFSGPGLLAWFGLLVVAQNVVSSAFNSHIADFNQGWLYVIGVGCVGGVMLRRRGADEVRTARPQAW